MRRNRGDAKAANSTEPSRWKDGMQVRGGRFIHTIAQEGLSIFALFGGLIMLVLTVLLTIFPGMDDLSPIETVFGGLIVFVPIGMLLFGLLGLGVEAGARAWLRSAPPVVSAAEQKAKALADRVGEAGLRPGSRWEQHYRRCVRSVTGYHEVVRELPTGAAQSWFEDVGKILDAELVEALRLAKLGDSLEHSSGPRAGLSPTGLRVDEQLQAAVAAFEQTTARAGDIALNLRDEPDFTRVQAQLDMLAEQTPQLRAEGGR